MNRTGSWRYLLQETALIPLLGYALLLGGTYNGLVLSNLRTVTTWLLALVGAAWLAVRLWKRWPFPHTPLDAPLLGYLAAHVITTLTSSDPRRSAIYVWLLGMYILLFYFFVDLLRHGWPDELFVKALLAVSVIVLGFGLRELALWYDVWHQIWGWMRPLPAITTRVHAFLGHPNWVAAFLNLLWPLALMRLLTTRTSVPRALLVIWLAAAAVLLYFTSSRGGWIGTITAAGVIFALKFRTGNLQFHRSNLKVWHLMFAAAAAGIAALIVWLLTWQLTHPSHGSLSGRQDFWETAWLAFRSAPAAGTGPFTYGETYLATHSIPPDALYGVAHNFIFNLAAESGLLGLAALAWLVITLAHALQHAWQNCPPENRAIYTGVLAALASCAAHSFFDSVETVPSLCFMLAILLAILLNTESPHTHQWSCAWALPLGWMILMVTAIWSLAGYRTYSQGILAANLGEWQAATSLLDTAVQRDPNLAYYQFQAGYAHGVRAAQGDADELAAAIARYQAGLARSPHYALNAANLGALYRQAEQLDRAIQWTQYAADQAPRSAVIALNLGRLYEESGDAAAAQRWYSATLNYAPEWADAYFWRSTPLRASAADAWRSTQPLPTAQTPRLADEWLAGGSNALAAGNHTEALAAFERAIQLDPNRAAAYLGQGRAYMAAGRHVEAERALRTALMAEGGTPLDYIRIQLALGQLYHEQGNTDQALALYQAALDAVRRPSVYGPGWASSSDYGWYLFYCETIYSDLLPQLQVITITDEMAERMLELGQWYEESGNRAAALRIYREALAAVPDLKQAHERIQALEKP